MDTRIIRIKKGNEDVELEETAQMLKSGAIISFPTETVFALGVNAENIESIKRVFRIKGTSYLNPLAFHLPDLEHIRDYVKDIPPEAEKLIEKFIPGPLLLMFEKAESVPEIITAGSRKIGIRVPRHGAATALLRKVGVPVVATSAAISGRIALTTFEAVQQELNGKIDIIVNSQDEEVLGVESTILDVTTRPFRIIRSGFIHQEEIAQVLGYAPILSDDDTYPKVDRVTFEMKIILVEGETEKVLRRMKALINNLPADSCVGLLLTEESAEYIGDFPYRKVMGSREDIDSMGKNLMTNLKNFEREGMKILLVEGLAREGSGWVMMERLERLANEVIRVE